MTISRREFIKHLLLLGGAVYCNPPPLWAAKPKLTPAYANLARKGELADRAASAYAVFQECRLCPRAGILPRSRQGDGLYGPAALW